MLNFLCFADLRDISSVLRNLLYITPNRQLLYVTDAYRSKPTNTFEHLSCFLPGLLTLGASTLPLSPHDRQLHQWAAQGLAYTCWITYADSETGLGPDEMAMKPGSKWLDAVDAWERQGRPGGVPPGLAEVPPARGKKAQKDYTEMKTGYLLRPEVCSVLHWL